MFTSFKILGKHGVEVDQEKMLVKVWERSLLDAGEELLDHKTGTYLPLSIEWVDGTMYIQPDESEVEEESSVFPKELNEQVFTLLFGNPKAVFYSGNLSGRGESQLVFDLDKTEYKHFMNLVE